jgi:hypothetical protein
MTVNNMLPSVIFIFTLLACIVTTLVIMVMLIIRKLRVLEKNILSLEQRVVLPRDAFGNEMQHRLTKTYNEKNQIVETSFYQKHREGHWLNIVTKGVGDAYSIKNVEFFVEHILSPESDSVKGKNFNEIAEECLKANEKVFDSPTSKKILVSKM